MQKKEALGLVVTLLKHVWQWKKDGWSLMHDGKVKKRGPEHRHKDCTFFLSCSSGARIRVRSQTLVAKKRSAPALKHSEGGLVSPATWWKPPVDFFLFFFLLLIRRVRMHSKPPLIVVVRYLCKIWVWQAHEGSGRFCFFFLHAPWVWSGFGLKPEWQMYGKLLDSEGHFVSFTDFLFFSFFCQGTSCRCNITG